MQAGNPNHIYFSGFGDELGGFGNCIPNTISANLIVLFLGSTFILFVLQVIWLWCKKEQSLSIQSRAFIICIIIATGVILLTALIFPRVGHGFMEGSTWLERDIISTPFILLAFLGFIISNLGPLIVGFLLKKHKGISTYSTGLLRLLILFLLVISTQIAVFVTAVFILWGMNAFYRFLNPPPHIYTLPLFSTSLKIIDLPSQKNPAP